MRGWAPLAVVVATWPLAAADLVRWGREANKVTLRLSIGAAEMEWISASTFRLIQCRSVPCAGRTRSAEAVDFTIDDHGPNLEITTKYLTVRIRKTGVLLEIHSRTGKLLLRDTGEGEREAQDSERFFGLGARAAESLDLRGAIVESGGGPLISSQGYGLYYSTPPRPVFDLCRTAPARVRVRAEPPGPIEYYFYYGPSPKEILEEHLEVTGTIAAPKPGHLELLAAGDLPPYAIPVQASSADGWERLAEILRRLAHGSLSGALVPAFDLAAWDDAPAAVRARASQPAAILPIVYRSRLGATPDSWFAERRKWTPYLMTYLQEARDRGLPVIHPLPLQYPADAEAARYADEFLVGDEILVAPIYSASDRRSVYLPMGQWTRLDTNLRYTGRRVVEITAPPERLPMFAKNGTIVPIAGAAADAPMELHYFPMLAAEFFLYEPDRGSSTQFHAAPAGDFMRLEIESKQTRLYEWVVHHLDPVAAVEIAGRPSEAAGETGQLAPGRWHYDRASRNLRIRIEAAADSDIIINITFKESEP